MNTQTNNNECQEVEILQSYELKSNETAVCIENFEGYSYKVYAVYINGEYDKIIKVSKF